MRFRIVFPTYEGFIEKMSRYGTYTDCEKLYNLLLDRYGNYDYRWDTDNTVFSHTYTVFNEIYRVWKIWDELSNKSLIDMTNKDISDTITRYRLDNDTDTEYKEFGDTKLTNERKELANPTQAYNSLLNSYQYKLDKTIGGMTQLFLPYYDGTEYVENY